MLNALKWAGYFAITTGIIIAIYLIASLKVIDINAIDYESPHPYRWLYAFLVLAVTVPVGLLSVTVSNHFDTKTPRDYTFDAKARKNESYHDRPFY